MYNRAGRDRLPLTQVPAKGKTNIETGNSIISAKSRRQFWITSLRYFQSHTISIVFFLIIFCAAFTLLVRWHVKRSATVRNSLAVSKDESSAPSEQEYYKENNSSEEDIKIIHFRSHNENSGHILPAKEHEPKIVALVEARNTLHVLPFFLRQLGHVVDSVVFLDDHSSDATVDFLMDNSARYKIESLIIKLGDWKRREEMRDRSLLLQEGRHVGGTHFVLLDYDEFFAAGCQHDLRSMIRSLSPGQSLRIPWIESWKHPTLHRVDDKDISINFLKRKQTVIFADDGNVSYDSQSSLSRTLGTSNGTIHTLKCPRTLCPPTRQGDSDSRQIDSTICYIIEMRFINMDNILLKSAWYEALGRISGAENGVVRGKMMDILSPLHSSKTISNIVTFPMKKTWIEPLMADLVVYDKVEAWRAWEIVDWFQKGTASGVSFEGLSSLDRIDWIALREMLNSDTKDFLPWIPRKKEGKLLIVSIENSSYHKSLREFFEGNVHLYFDGACNSADFENNGVTDMNEYETRRRKIEPLLRGYLASSEFAIVIGSRLICEFGEILIRDMSDVHIDFLSIQNHGEYNDFSTSMFAERVKSEIGHIRLFVTELEIFCQLKGLVALFRTLDIDTSWEEMIDVIRSNYEVLSCKSTIATLVFSSNVGRSGSKHLAHCLNSTRNDVIALHEPGCPRKECTNGGAMSMQNQTLASSYSYRRSVKLPLIWKALGDLAQSDTPRLLSLEEKRESLTIIKISSMGSVVYGIESPYYYIETNPNFKSWIFDFVLSELSKQFSIIVLVLRKYIPAVVLSIYQTGFFTERNGYTWMETANSVNAKLKPIGEDQDLDGYDKIISYVLNAEAVTEYMMKTYQHPNIKFLSFRSEVLYEWHGILDLLMQLQLQPSDKTIELASQVQDKYLIQNDENHFQDTTKRIIRSSNLTYCEERVHRYISICKSQNIELPQDLSHLNRHEAFQYHS